MQHQRERAAPATRAANPTPGPAQELYSHRRAVRLPVTDSASLFLGAACPSRSEHVAGQLLYGQAIEVPDERSPAQTGDHVGDPTTLASGERLEAVRKRGSQVALPARLPAVSDGESPILTVSAVFCSPVHPINTESIGVFADPYTDSQSGSVPALPPCNRHVTSSLQVPCVILPAACASQPRAGQPGRRTHIGSFRAAVRNAARCLGRLRQRVQQSSSQVAQVCTDSRLSAPCVPTSRKPTANECRICSVVNGGPVGAPGHSDERPDWYCSAATAQGSRVEDGAGGDAFLYEPNGRDLAAVPRGNHGPLCSSPIASGRRQGSAPACRSRLAGRDCGRGYRRQSVPLRAPRQSAYTADPADLPRATILSKGRSPNMPQFVFLDTVAYEAESFNT